MPAIAVSIALFLGSARPAMAAESDIALRTKIVSATVYADRAQVTRSGRIELGAGSWKIVCDDLPQAFDEASLRVEGAGAAETRIMGVDVVTLRGRIAESPRYKELKGKLERLSGRRDTLRIELGAFQSSLAYLDDLAKFPFEKGSSKLATEIFRVQDWKNVLEFLGAERVKTNERIDGHSKKIAKLSEEIAWIEKELANMRMRDDWSKRVAVDIEAKTAGPLEIDLVYNVGGASWAPEYTIRYRTADEAIVLGYNARIRQSTGEDWSGVAVTLSTARPQIGAASPEIQPYYLARRMPRIMKSTVDESKVRGGRDKETSYDLAQAAVAPAPEVFEAERPGADLETSSFAATFSVPKRIDLPSGADPRRVLILEDRLAGALSRHAAPRLSQNVFVRAAASNTLAVPLLAGIADVYVETGTGAAAQSTFVGKVALQQIAPGQEFPVPLGADQDYKVTQKLEKKEYLAKEGAATKKIRYHFVVALESFKKEAVPVKIQDRIPVSTLKEVRVTSVDLSPRPAEQLENGIVTWNLAPAPKSKVEIRVAYTIEFPGDWDESMLNLE
jgi:uncharacterized protein (TIGR02231 family)